MPSSLEFKSPVLPRLKINQQDFAGIHYFTQIECTLILADDVAHHVITQECTELTYKPADNFTEFIGRCD
jgi:hypothetical protein